MNVNDDAQLLSRSRAGDAGAYAQLYERHVGTALHVARQLTDEAEDVVSDAFTRTYTVLREGRGPDVAFRPYLLRAVRNAAIDRHRRVRRITPLGSLEDAETPLNHEQPPADPAIDQLEQQLVARAFQSLPERWQMVLWHTEVQGETPAQVAPLLGISPRAVAQLAVRAREGLRTAWLREHIVVAPPGHEEMVRLLAAHVRGSLGLRDRRALETHLTECADCRRLRDELKDANNRLRVILVPALLGLSITKLAWGAPHAAAAVAVPAAGAAAVGTARGAGGGLAGGAAAEGSGTAGAATTAAVGGTVSAPSAAGSTTAAGGLLGATMAAVSQPVTAGLVAVAVATTGFGAYVAIGSDPVDPAPPGESRPAQVTPPSPGPGPTDGPPPTGSGSPGPGPTDGPPPTGSGSPSPTTAPGTGTPGSTGPTTSPSTSGSGTATDSSTSGSPSAGPGATSGGPTAGSSASAAPGSSPPSTSPSTSSSATPSTTVPSRRTPPP